MKFCRWSMATATALLFCLCAWPAFAREIQETYSIRDRGQLRHFEIALDEIHAKTGSRKILLLPNAAAVRQHAKLLNEQTRSEFKLVLYERGVPKNEFTRRILTKEILVQLQPAIDAKKLAQQFNLRLEQQLQDGFFIFKTTETAGSLIAAEQLRAQPGVLFSEAQLARQLQKRSAPNDLYFSQQWHLRNTGQNGGTAGIDVNITNVWNTFRGAGITIGILDDGLQLTHPDLAPNVNTNIDWDFNDNDDDPSPALGNDIHGTPVAGVAGARGNNGLGVCGAAYESTLVGLRLISDPSTDQMESAAMLHSNSVIFVKNNSWGPADGIGILEGPGPLTQSALQQGALTGRDGKGTIYVWAGGNGGDRDNANYDGYVNSIYSFAIAALADNGTRAHYSEPGACLVVTAPSSSRFRQGITTTDLLGNSGYNFDGVTDELGDLDYTKQFGGTSSASPLAAGVIALLLQANPNLGYRDVKEILMRSATKNSPADSDWQTNASGIRFNHQFGAGLLNAESAISLATNWSNLGAAQQLSFAQTNLAIPIPDNDPTGITRTFQITNENFRVEHVTLTVNAPHSFFGDLQVTLTSPAGMKSILAEKHSSSGSGYNNWKFSSVRNWGENANGTWTVQISDRTASNQGILNDLQLEIHGTQPAAQLSITQVTSNREITLHAAAFGWNYTLQTSTNLLNWSNSGVFHLTNNGVSKIVETNAPTRTQFYRAILLP